MNVKLASVGVAAASGVITIALAVAHPSVLAAGASGTAAVSKQTALDNIARIHLYRSAYKEALAVADDRWSARALN